ncbi:hypothetical protein [Xanthovirga aplysinae]|uniref:hypothetical protein n=1 Tax=Xanthovirga aplysinae TaxID=2529853 RepID=UPI0012BB6AB3|nr:hypothetical protein [Xanthovirga aplysinae]MTI32693.1 hypothetical protein [Xanthovirga aplysinae]
MFKSLILSLLFLNLFFLHLQAQNYSPFPAGHPGVDGKKGNFRQLLNKFSFNISSGYSRTFYSHSLENFDFISSNNVLYIKDKDSENLNYYAYWLNGPTKVDFLNSNSLFPEEVHVPSDSIPVKLRGASNGIPINLYLLFNVKRFRVGGGYSMEWQRFENFNLDRHGELLGQYKPEITSNVASRYYLMLGYNYFTYRSRVWNFNWVADAQVGYHNLGTAFSSLPKKSQFFTNLGLTIEQEYSEYFKIFIRPSVELKRFDVPLLEEERTIKNLNPAASVQLGISIRFPDLPRCPIKTCKTQIIHVHNGQKFRGQPIYKKQNRKYGENNRKLLKYKRKYRNDK